MKFGISTTVLREYRVAYALERIAGAGYRSAEVWFWHLERYGEDARQIAVQARKLGLALTYHAPGGGDLNSTDADPEKALQAQEEIIQALQVAAELEAQVVALHPGRKSSPEEARSAAWSRLADWVEALDRQAQVLGLRIGLELMEKLPLEIFMIPEDAAALLSLPLRQVGLTVDIAHMNTHGDPLAFLAALDPAWIWHVHLSDNAPHRVHLPLGEGQMDLGAVLEALEQVYAGIVSIEGSVPEEGEMLLARNMNYLKALGWG